jgi:hypothetical protein
MSNIKKGIIYVPFVPITLIRILLLIEIFLLSGFDKGTLILSVLLNATSKHDIQTLSKGSVKIFQ